MGLALFLEQRARGDEGVRAPRGRTLFARDTDRAPSSPTTAYGLGFWVNQDLGYFGELGIEGAWGWGSAYYPQHLVDPKERRIALFMTPLMPSGGLDLMAKIKVHTCQSLAK